MSGASLAGTDSKGNPFQINAATGRLEYDRPDTVIFENINGNMTKAYQGKKDFVKFSADGGEYEIKTKILHLIGNVNIISQEQGLIQTSEITITLGE